MKIKNAMSTKNISIDAIALVLEVHRNTASNKVNGKISFTVDEAFKLKSDLFPEYDIEYLFSDDSNHDNQQATASSNYVQAQDAS